MSDPSLPANVREFHCNHCNGKIRIPKDLPPTTGPCPHCRGIITSPVPESAGAASFLPPPAGTYSVTPPPAQPVVPIPIPSESPQYQPPTPAPVTVASVPAVPSYEPGTHAAAPPQPAAIPAYESGIPAAPAPPPAAAPAYEEAISAAAPPQPVAAPAIEPAPSAAQSLPKRRGPRKPEIPVEPKKSLVPVIALSGLLLAFAAGAGFMVIKEMKNREAAVTIPANTTNSMAESQYLRIGWQKEAYGVLGKFLAGKSAIEKLPHIINGGKLKPQVEAFYGGSVINDQDTPADAFSVNDLSDEDKKRGIFMLVFDQPPQFEMKEFFRPLATLEVQYGLNEADLLLSTMARVGNFATEPVRVSAFFKKTPEGLKLDWETFVQTKYRTFQTLIELPEAGQGGVFRLVISEDVPETGRALAPGMKTYRMWDPASPETSARVNVNIDSEIGRTLSKIDWRGKVNRPVNSTATLELKWAGTDQPKLEISRFICWEFLHLGGTETPAPAR